MSLILAIGVYPRACGGTTRVLSTRSAYSGLSPRLRGNHVAHGNGYALHRSIPAPAGNLRKECAKVPGSRSIPRLRGNPPRQGF